jgi:hypothetical protein
MSKLKQRLGIQVETKTREMSSEIESIHTPSFSIGDSLGDIKVGVVHLKTQLERIEGSMLSKDYFEQEINSRDKGNLIIDKLDEALRVLSEFQPRKPSIEPSRPSLEPRTPSLTEEAKSYVERRVVSLRLQQVIDVFGARERTTPKQLARLLSIKTNTACEHLRSLERLGFVRRIERGLYELI